MKSTATEPAWLVIGYGNPLRGDDGAAWAVVDALSAVVDPREVRLLSVHQLTPELAAPLSAARRAAFVDAAVDLPRGEVRCVPLVPRPAGGHATAHRADPASLLWVAEQAYGCCARCHWVTIGGGDFEIGERLSPAVRASVSRAVELLRGMVRGHSDD